MLKLLNINLQSINYDARDVYSFVNRQLAVTGDMNTASGDSGGTGGSSESSVADIFHKLVSPINPDRWVYNTDEPATTQTTLRGMGTFQIVQMS